MLDDKPLDEARSQELAKQVKAKAKAPFKNAHQGVLATAGAVYVQGFVVAAGKRPQAAEHAWIELEDCILDPSLPFLNQPAQNLHYFPAQRLTVKQLKAAIEVAQEDYPEDDPLPIYGSEPYQYYGDLMLGGREYEAAHQAAENRCKQLKHQASGDLN